MWDRKRPPFSDLLWNKENRHLATKNSISPAKVTRMFLGCHQVTWVRNRFETTSQRMKAGTHSCRYETNGICGKVEIIWGKWGNNIQAEHQIHRDLAVWLSWLSACRSLWVWTPTLPKTGCDVTCLYLNTQEMEAGGSRNPCHPRWCSKLNAKKAEWHKDRQML